MKPDRRLTESIESYLDHRLDEVGRFELAERLLTDAGCRQEFWRLAEMEGLLREWGRAQAGVDDAIRDAPERPRPTGWPRRWLMAATGIAAAAVVAAALWGPHAKPVVSPSASSAIAVLTQASEARWRPGSAIPAMGQFIGTGTLELESGWAMLEFVSGAELMITGPAQVQVCAANEITCESGSLTIQQPTPSAGFVVRTPAGVLQDIYHTVALQVRPETTDLLVASGRGSLRLKDGGSTPCPVGEILRIVRGGTFSKITGKNDVFARQLQHAARQSAVGRALPGHWLAASKRQNMHPDLLLRYTFDDIPPDLLRVPNQASRSGPGVDGAIGGGAIRQGRWPFKKALEFQRRFDGVRMTVPGTYETITMAAWIRIDSLNNTFNAIFMSDGIRPGGLHWQIRDSGSIGIGVLKGTYPAYESPPVITPERFGKWLHLAVVYDLNRGSTSHYLNGRLVSRHALEEPRLVLIRSAMLGNWDPANDYDPAMIRNFNGRIDDFSIYQTALSDDEIKELYEQGLNGDQ